MIECDEAEVIELLVEAGLLDPRADYFEREDIAAAVAKFLQLARNA